ncbi:MAG: SUF system Fe-S cluster assembly protein [Hyphomicrobiaceae bacterium]
MLDLEAASKAAAPATETGSADALAETTATPERHPKALDLESKPATGSALSSEEIEQMTADIVAAIKTVYDPEIPADIYELGLIYTIDMDDDRNVDVVMTLTAPGCPVAGEMPIWVENAVASVAGVGRVQVELTFDPPWEMSRMSDEARLALNMF